MEKEILEFVRAMNRCWTAGDPSELKNYFHKDMVAITPTGRYRLEGREACVAAWSSFARNARIHTWKERDHKIQVYGSAAVVTYYYDISFDMGGQSFHVGGRDMFTLIKENGRWWAVADQFSSFPAG